MRSSFWHLPKRCRCGELLCRRSRVQPDRSFRIRCLRCRRARRKQRVCLLYKSTSRFQPQNQPGHRSALQRSEVRLPPERFCFVPFLLLRALSPLPNVQVPLLSVRFRLQCDYSPPHFVSLRLLRDWFRLRLGCFRRKCARLHLLTCGFVRFAGRFCPHSFCFGGFSAVFGIHPGCFGQYSPFFGGCSAFSAAARSASAEFRAVSLLTRSPSAIPIAERTAESGGAAGSLSIVEAS